MREYGQILSAIWRDREFRKMPTDPQWLYLALVTQPDISSCGVLTLAERRWAGYAEDQTPGKIGGALIVLESARFVVLDQATGELLVRSFIKHDKGYRNKKRVPAIVAAIRAVDSEHLLDVIAQEMAILDMPDDVRECLLDALSPG
ncbi:hypothetical protein [Cumulibacter soli]|uniref:hypothetical protein n=1 Tax=Cumulibacter soli TaxID=2546344 RepID=UPI001067B515|nr:hypothetical protein [Cumulibacter soli]